MVANFGKWRGRRLSPKERDLLGNCGCPSCIGQGPPALEDGGITGFAARATHNLWVLSEEAADIDRRLATPSYLEWVRSHVDNRIFRVLIEHSVQAGITARLVNNRSYLQYSTEDTRKVVAGT